MVAGLHPAAVSALPSASRSYTNRPTCTSTSIVARVVCQLIRQAPLQRLGDREIGFVEATAAGGDRGPRQIAEHRACLRLQRQMKLTQLTSEPEL